VIDSQLMRDSKAYHYLPVHILPYRTP